MQRPSLDTLPPLSDPIGSMALPSLLPNPRPASFPWLAGFLFSGVRKVAGEPVARLQPLAQRRLGAARLGPVVVFEAHPRRQAHQDALGAPARLQPEQRAAVPHQVE